MRRLTDNFSLDELTRSARAAELGIDNSPSLTQLANLARLAANVLEPIRAAAGRPVRITSGLRVPALNRAVGGSPRSDHMDGRAADIQIVGMPPADLERLIVSLDLPVRQVICEFGQWVHVSVPPDGEPPVREALTAVRIAGRTEYRQGIV